MSLKDTKIFIPEIPAEWTQRTRSGHTNVWNHKFYRNGLPEIRLDPPQRGLYAELFEDGWYWVCDCPKCLGKDDPYPYIVCDEHDRCQTCNIHRSELKEIPWGKRGGWQCRPCYRKEHEEIKRITIEMARQRGHSEDDCCYMDEIICPRCGTEQDDCREHDESQFKTECYVCDTKFEVEVEYEAKYTSRLI